MCTNIFKFFTLLMIDCGPPFPALDKADIDDTEEEEEEDRDNDNDDDDDVEEPNGSKGCGGLNFIIFDRVSTETF